MAQKGGKYTRSIGPREIDGFPAGRSETEHDNARSTSESGPRRSVTRLRKLMIDSDVAFTDYFEGSLREDPRTG